jgi:hypothetical protein
MLDNFKNYVIMFFKWVESFLTWDKLRTVQDNKIVSSTYVWLVIVPTAAKASSKIQEIFNVDISLPFSWQVFFYSSLFFVVGNVVFLVSAPEIIKEYRDYSEFLTSKRDVKYLKEFRNARMVERDEHIDRMVSIGGGRTAVNNPMDSDKMAEYFYKIYDESNVEYVWVRSFCGLLYSIGFVLFSWVAISNIWWVLFR